MHFFKIGALPNIQSRLNSRDPRTFKSAIRAAQSAESEKAQKKTVKVATKETLSVLKEVDKEKEASKTEVAELCHVIRQLIAKPTENQPPVYNNHNPSLNRPDNRIAPYTQNNRKCFHCQKTGHTYMYCRNARDNEKQAITERLTRRQGIRQYNTNR